MKRMLVALSCGVSMAASAVAVPAAAQTERPQTTLAGHLVVRDECVISNLADMDARTRATSESGLFAPIIAGFAGNLLSGAVGEIASAIRRASEEHAYTLVGSDGYLSGNIIRSEASGVSTYQFVPEPKCLILHVPSDPLQRRGTGPSPYAQFAYADLGGEQVDESLADPRDADLAGIGINRVAPAVYIELALLPGPEGVMVRPMFVWYREPIASAGMRSRSTELLVELATPFHAAGGDPLGTLFGVSRIRLPRLQPGHTPLRSTDLEGLGATYIPYRPSTGPLGTQIAALQAAEAALSAARGNVRTTARAEVIALRNLQAQSTPANRAAHDDAVYAAQQANTALTAAENALNELRRISGTATAGSAPVVTNPAAAAGAATVAREAMTDGGTVGAVNARVSFMVIRDPNRFGLAIAGALQSQQAAAGTALTQALTPQPAWRTQDTAMLTATLDVQVKQAAYNTAVQAGDATKILEARNALLLSKAAANAAAVAAGQGVLPYPELLQEASAGQ